MLSGPNSRRARNLKACIGECDSDAQCATGLECFQREKGEKIPGCSGNGGGDNWDYCYDPIAAGETVLSGPNNGRARNLQACIGECDSDAQCATDLKCYQREHGEHIPGCSGKGGGKNWDYCYDPSHPQAQKWNA